MASKKLTLPIYSIRAQQGMTFLELFIVFAIASFILYMILNQYRMYKRDADIQQLKYNVDALFQAASRFYQANCTMQMSANGPVSNTGVLDPSNSFFSYYPITISQLQTAKMLDIPTTGVGNPPFPQSYLVDSSTGLPYAIQYNVKLVNGVLPTKTANVNNSPVLVQNQFLLSIQVAVKMPDNATAKTYKDILLADCISDISSGVVANCQAPITGGSYLVWERLPSRAVPTITGEWLNNPTIKQFNEMYESQPIVYLLMWHSSQFYMICNS